MRGIILAGAALLATSASAETIALPAEPDVAPDWSAITPVIEQRIVERLDHPDQARIEWIQGFAWGTMKSVIGGREFGWVACGKLAKGPDKKGRQFSVLYAPSGQIEFGYAGKIHSSCWTRTYVPPNQVSHLMLGVGQQ